MSDVHSPEIRSKNMRAIRSVDTKPEIRVRKALFAAGYRYRIHKAGLPGKPDVVLPKYKTAIFVHGCFWHGHDCKYFKPPKTRSEFWQSKIEANRARDKSVIARLNCSGWHVILIWECATRSSGIGLTEIVNRVSRCLARQGSDTPPGLTEISG